MSKANRIKRQHEAAKAAAPATPRVATRRVALLASGMLVAAVVVTTAIILNGSRASDPSGQIVGATDAVALVRGVPQQGTSLGRDDAPLTLRVYTEPQCPYCREWDATTFPLVVADFVRSGKLRVEFRGLAFVSGESIRGLRTLLALGQQNKLFEGQSLLYANQGTEGSGWLSDVFLDRLVAAIPGVDRARLARDVAGKNVAAEVDRAAAQAAAAAVNSTPTVFIGPTGGLLKRIELTSFDPSVTIDAIKTAAARTE